MTKAPFLSTNNVPFKYLKYVKLIDFEIAISLNWIPDDWPSWNLNLNRSINWFKRDSMRYLKEPCIELRLQYSVRRTYTEHTPAFSADYNLSARFKNSGKCGSGLSCHWIGPCLRLSFRIQAASYFLQSWVRKTGSRFFLADFHDWHWHILALMRTRLNIEPYFPLKLT